MLPRMKYSMRHCISLVGRDGARNGKRFQEVDASVISQFHTSWPETLRTLVGPELRKWLSPPDPWENYNITRETFLEGTGRWFTQGDTFAKWKSSRPLLWVHGKRLSMSILVHTVAEINDVTAGSGKSFLRYAVLLISPFRRTFISRSSAIIQDLEGMRELGSASVVFFFFDFRHDEKQTRRNLLSSLLVQLCDQSNIYYDIFFKCYGKCHHGSRQPSNNEVTECLKEMLNVQSQDPIYFIIDALDECPANVGTPSARETVLKLVRELVDLHCPNLHICITSRPEPDIKAILSPLEFHAVSIHDQDGQKQDINNYIHHVVASVKNWRPVDKKLVIDTLCKRADGM